ncbi:lmo0954 family membrane protein [Planococcus lenghuensis]|uniref:ABC transporter permease n=1 Tax=Planococcus lenghuensis TaxID=2213202 RepID=A0A1Q2L1Q4_9BACL|nr:ABC transporter permease [Planococcus lenghuensis]AQQ54388.1 ABC transporter permease [Planococcus lenghuensis]
MNKFWLAVIGITAGIVALANLGSLLGLIVSAAVVYAGIHFYQRSVSTPAKVWWGIVIVIGVVTAIANVPAFFAVAGLIVLWMVYRRWNGEEVSVSRSKDPFTNFENQWKQLKK